MHRDRTLREATERATDDTEPVIAKTAVSFEMQTVDLKWA